MWSSSAKVGINLDGNSVKDTYEEYPYFDLGANLKVPQVFYDIMPELKKRSE